MNDLFLRALKCEEVSRPPVWLMRQAGRYMPEYRALREKHTLKKLFQTPQLAAQVTRQPLERFGVDAAILFSDILVVAEGLGLSVDFPDQGGPRVSPPIHTAEQVRNLASIPVEESLHYVFETISLLRPDLKVPLIGFSGAPFTVASYFIDSSSKTAFERTKRWMREDPASFHLLLSKITEVTIAYLKAQVRSGVHALQIFDSWAGILDDEQFSAFSARYLQQIVDALRETEVPVLLFCRGSSLRAEALSAIGPAGISFDWHRSMKELRHIVPKAIAVQGNFDPEFLKRPPAEIEAEVREVLSSMRGERGYIVNLGHGVTPDIPVEHVRCFVDTVKSESSVKI